MLPWVEEWFDGIRAVTWSDFGNIYWEWGLDEWTIKPIEAERFEFERREYVAALGFDRES